jgi:putative N6-adenine-specific DNA methylase
MIKPDAPEGNETLNVAEAPTAAAPDPDRLFAYRKTWRFFAQIGEGLEEEGAGELAELGAIDPVPSYRGIHFGTDFPGLCRINYQTRLCTRILAPLISFDCHSTKYLHKIAVQLPWEVLLGPDGTMAIAATVANSAINHSKYAALCLKDALADHYVELYGHRPNVDRDNPDLQLNLHIDRNRAVISLDTSGSSLHRRGYRQESVAAPMQETLAAAIIRLSGWDGSRPLVDPFCGSGTLLCEALMRQARIPAGYFRPRFGFELLPEFQRQVWEQERTRLNGLIREVKPGLISGSDFDRTAVKASRTNLSLLLGGREVRVSRADFRDLEPLENTVIVANPPYGLRMGDPEGSAALLKEFGDFLKQRCQGSEAYLYFGRREMLKQIGLRPAWKKPLRNGGLDGVLAKYLMY